MEGPQTIRNSGTKLGALVKFKYIDKVVTENIRRMKEDIGIVVSLAEDACIISTDSGLKSTFWIIEVIVPSLNQHRQEG